MKKPMVFGILAVLVAGLALGAGLSQGAEKLTVGWQPYYIDSFTPAVIQELGLTRKYLPGVEVEYIEGLHTAIYSDRILAGRCQVGYGAVMPLNICCSRRDQADVREVLATSYSNGQRCSLMMARADAPDFKSPEEAMKWLNGKMVASPRGSCADQFMRLAFQKLGVKPAEYLNQNIEIITTNFQAKKLDASAVWEPSASRLGNLAGEGIAKLVATGNIIGNKDLGMMMMRGDFIDGHPDLAKGWLKCELEAERFIYDPKNREKAVEMIAKHAVGMPKRAIWFALFGQIPEQVGGVTPKTVCPFIIDDRIRKEVRDIWDFQYKQKLVPTETPPANLIDDHLTREVLAEAGLTSPIGKIDAIPADKNPFK
jgi:NitT/TauT family transport system substrate-binding protein